MQIDFFTRNTCWKKRKANQQDCKRKGKCLRNISEADFGLCDSQGNKPACIDIDNQQDWDAVVRNPQKIELQFYAVDHCLHLHDGKGNALSSCDCMIVCPERNGKREQILFIELKDCRQTNNMNRLKTNGKQLEIESWLKKGFEQILATLLIFQKSHRDILFSDIKAYVCNKQEKTLPLVIDRTDILNEYYSRSKELSFNKKAVLFYVQAEIKIE